jgi:hypothetical protein
LLRMFVHIVNEVRSPGLSWQNIKLSTLLLHNPNVPGCSIIRGLLIEDGFASIEPGAVLVTSTTWRPRWVN